jgi:protein-disulfide isomerase
MNSLPMLATINFKFENTTVKVTSFSCEYCKKRMSLIPLLTIQIRSLSFSSTELSDTYK